MADWMKDYLDTVTQQIRWKRARPSLTAELQDHLQAQYDACLDAGLQEPDAQAEALRQMGDAVLVGQELDRVHRPKAQWGLLLLTVALAIAGAVLRGWVIYTADGVVSQRLVLYLVLGIGALFGCYFLDYSFLGRHACWVYGGMVALGVLALLYSPQYYGASYYARYIVLCYPVVYGCLVYQLCGKGWFGFGLALLGWVVLAVICLAAPSMVGLLLLGFTGLITLGLAIWCNWFRVPRVGAFAILAALVLGMLVFALAQGVGANFYRRLELALHPGLDPAGSGYIGMVIADVLAGAKSWGTGTITGGDYWQAMPLADADFAFVSLIHTFGWIPFLLICAALLALLILVTARGLRQRGLLARVVTINIILTLGLQIALSIAVNLGFVLISATCPFLLGSFHTVIDLALTGVLLSIFRQEKLPGTASLRARCLNNRFRWQDGELIIRLGRRGPA